MRGLMVLEPLFPALASPSHLILILPLEGRKVLILELDDGFEFDLV